MEIVAWRKEATAGNGGGEGGERAGGARWDLPLSLPSHAPRSFRRHWAWAAEPSLHPSPHPLGATGI